MRCIVRIRGTATTTTSVLHMHVCVCVSVCVCAQASHAFTSAKKERAHPLARCTSAKTCASACVCSPSKNTRQSAGKGGAKPVNGQLNDSSASRATPRSRPGPAEAPPGTPRGGPSKDVAKLNPSTAKLLEDVFLAYCGAKSGAHVKSVSLDYPGWHAFCSECRLVEGKTSHELLRDLYNRAASGGGRADGSVSSGRLNFEAFVGALTTMAEAKYGATDSIARLVYFKIVRFGRTAGGAQLASSPRAPSPPATRSPKAATSSARPASPHAAGASPRHQGRGRQATRGGDGRAGIMGGDGKAGVIMAYQSPSSIILPYQSPRSEAPLKQNRTAQTKQDRQSQSNSSSASSSPSPHTRLSRAAAAASHTRGTGVDSIARTGRSAVSHAISQVCLL